MTEVAKIVRDALVLAGITDATEAPEAEDMADGITALNRMMHGWEVDGLNFGWSDVSAPDEQYPAPVETEEAVVYNLAVRLSGAYGLDAKSAVVAIALSGMDRMRAYVASNDYARCTYDDLPVGTGQRSGSWMEGFFR